jgi:hypothetical protein
MVGPERWHVNDEEFGNVRALPPAQRYEHFLQRVADTESVWLLTADDEAALVSEEGVGDFLAAWPHPRYAEAEREHHAWERYAAGSVDLDTWMNIALADLAADGVGVAVFPVWGNGAWIVSPPDLHSDLGNVLRPNYDE